MKRIRSMLAMLALVGLASPLHAQLQSGAIYGTVVDPSGASLPGVTVTLSLPPIKTKVSSTGSQGEFRFLNLPPGNYEVTMALSGFDERKRSVSVGVGKNAELRQELALAGTKIELEVVGSAPVLETKKTGTATNVPLSELQAIPSARDPWVVLSSVPSVLVDRVNVGGSESGQQSVFAGKGDNGDNTMWNIDGVTITDMGSIGSSPTYYDFDSFEEFQVSTGGNDPKLQTGGIGINMVTKRGGNDFHGSARLFFTNDSLQGDNIPANIAAINQAALDGGATNPPFPGNRIRQIAEYGGELGGPVVKDRFWFWGAWAKNDIRQLAASGVPDNTQLKDSSAKLNGQLTDSNQATFFWYRGDKIKTGRSAAVTRPPETTWNQSGPTNIYKWEDFQNFGADFYLSGKFNYVTSGFQLTPQGGRETAASKDAMEVWHRSYLHYETNRPQWQGALDGNLFKTWGSSTHEFKFGFNWRRTPVQSLSSWPGDGTVSDASFPGIVDDSVGLVWLTRDALRSSTMDSTGFYVGDTITRDRLTMNLGMRFDHQSGNSQGGSVPASGLAPELLPALNIEDGTTPFKWNDLSPRVGLTYALGEDRKTLVRGSYANYADQLSSSILTFDNPFAGPAEIDYLWVADTNGDGIAQRSEVDFDTILGSYYVDPANPTSVAGVNQIDPNLSAPRTNELIAGVEREVLPNFSIGSNFTWRKRSNEIWTPFRKADGSIVTSADYELDRMLTPDNLAAGPIRDWYTSHYGDDFSVPFYKLKSGVELSPGNGQLQTNRDGYSTRYLGLELFLTKRLSNKWSARGSFAWNSWKEYFDGPQAIEDPTSIQNSPNIDGGIAYSVVGNKSGTKGDVFLNGKWQFNANMVYQLPMDFNIAASVIGRQGYPAPLYIRRSDPDGLTTEKRVLIVDPDAYRMGNVYNLDLRAEKSFKFLNRHNVVFDVDLFNVFNNNQELQINRRADTTVASTDETSRSTLTAFLRPREIIAPRVFRFGLRYSF